MSRTDRQNVYIHPTADVAPDAEIGAGTRIWNRAQIRERAHIGCDCILGKDVYVDFDVTIGDRCKLQNGVYVYHPATVGDGVFLGPGVIATNDKRPRAVNPDRSLKSDSDWIASPVRIGEGASIGAGSILLPGVEIGRWALVGSGSVVTKDIPHFGLARGVPARLVGYVCLCGCDLAPVGEARYRCNMCRREYAMADQQLEEA